jgi:hypothetical protein
MTRGSWRWPLVIVLAVATFAFGVVLGLPFSSRAQQPAPPSTAPTTTPPPAPTPPTASAPESDYVGAETCKGCHEEAYNKFAKTRMGRVFLFQARTPGEKNACENCHGPGKAHVEAGGGKGKGGLITFARNDPTPVEKRNAVCLECHTKGARIFWKGERARVAQRGLYELSHADGTMCPRSINSPRPTRSRPAGPVIFRSARRPCGARTCRCARGR